MFSDQVPSMVFPDTPDGRKRLSAFVAEEPSILHGACRTCDRYEVTRHPVYTDDDYYRPKGVDPCANRNRSGVRDNNWCCRCIAGVPHQWQTSHDGLRDFNTLTGF